MDKIEQKRLLWNEAATCGLFVGIIYTAMLYIEYFFTLKLDQTSSQIYSFVQIGIYIYIIYYAIRRYRDKRGDLGLTYIQGLGFGVLMMLFSGVIYGIGYYFMFNNIATEYFVEILREASLASGLDADMAEMAIEQTKVIYGNPLTCIFSTMFSSALGGALISLIVAIYTRRYPKQEENK